VPVRLVVPNNGRNPPFASSSSRWTEGPRRDTSMEALAKLRPAFHVAAR